MRTCLIFLLLAMSVSVGIIAGRAGVLPDSWAPSSQPGASAAASPSAGSLRNGLIAQWAGEGDFIDRVGGAQARAGGDPGGVTLAPGRTGQAFQLDGKTGHLIVEDTGRLNLRQYVSFALWIKPVPMNNEWHPLVYKGGGDSYSRTYSLWLHESGTLHLSVADATGMQCAETARNLIRAGTWYHVACVVDRHIGQVQIFVDGRLREVSVIRAEPNVSTRAPLLIGGTSEPGPTASPFAGLIDSVAVWDRPLTSEEVRRLYEGDDPRSSLARPHVTRPALGDRAVLADGSVLAGNVVARAWVVTGAAGKVELPADRVAGLLGGGDGLKPGAVRVLLADGQVVAGEPADPTVEFKLFHGATVKLPVADIREIGLQQPPADKSPAGGPVEPTVTLVSGDRLFWSELAEPIQLKTDLPVNEGVLDLPAGKVLSLELAGERGGKPVHRAVLANGGIVSGTLMPDQLTFTCRLGGKEGNKIKVAAGQVRQIIWQTRPAAPAGSAVMTLRNGDRLLGKLAEKELTITTKFGAVPLAFADVQELTISLEAGAAPGEVRAVARLWLDQTLTGRLAAGTVAFALAENGPALKVPLGQIASITNPPAGPPASFFAWVEGVITQLGAPKFADREAASAALKRMGPEVLPILRKHIDDPDSEIQYRVRQLLAGQTP